MTSNSSTCSLDRSTSFRHASGTVRKKILIVDDSETTRNLIHRLLKDEGNYEFTFADNGLEAMVRLEREPFDLLITDIIMPFIDGLKLISYIRNSANLKGLPIVVISQKGRESDYKQGFLLGANAYLVKPLTKRALMQKFNELLPSR
jgi:two-component system, chemotaxis family, chemotaxis protein CheY